MIGLPQGTLTFLLTDLEGSTRAWEADAALMRRTMSQHDAIVYAAVERSGGAMVESGREGDSVLAAFVHARGAVACALEIQRAFRAADWPGDLRPRIRIALHTGEVELRGGHYFGPPLNRCARVLALCHGGQTLVTRATRELIGQDPPPDVELTDLGLHQLKDLKRSEHVYQLTDVRQPERFAPLQARREYRTNIAIPLSRFIGRQRELSDLRELLDRTRLLTVAGTGGAGKTRLAKQLALEAAATVTGGAWFVDLAPISDATLVPRTVATTLDLDEQRGRALLETIVDRCAREPMLVVLDNCEHLLQACAELVETLLARCADLRIVATSREPLNIAGETVWRIPPLSPAEAMRLFEDRARSRSASVGDGRSDLDAIATICRRVDGIPLAIELAAARMATMTADEILRRLSGGLGVLAGGSRTSARRQQALEATIDWSHELLSAPERVLLRRLGVFAGRFSLEAAEAVCEGSELPREAIFDVLGHLVLRSLVQRIDDRYGLLDTIRAYARAKLERSGEAPAVRRQLAEHCLRLTSARRPGALAAWLDAVEQDHDNIREALRWCADAEPVMGAHLARAMFPFWLQRGHVLEARVHLERLVPLLPHGSPERARALLDLGGFAYTAGDERGPRYVDEGLEEARVAGERDVVASGLSWRGLMAMARGDLDVADAALGASLPAARAAGDLSQEAETLRNLGVLATLREDIPTARSRIRESLEILSRAGERDEAGTTLALLGVALLIGSDPSGARSAVTEALEIALALRDRRAAWALDVLACVTALEGDARGAVRLAGSAEAMFAATGQRPPGAWYRVTRPYVERARAALGPQVAAEAWRQGQAATFEEALHFALEGEPAGALTA